MKTKAMIWVAIAATTVGAAAAVIGSATAVRADRPGTYYPSRTTYPSRPSNGGASSTPSTTPSATRSSGTIKASTAEERVYVYTQPDNTSQVVGYAYDNDPIYVYDSADGGWYYVEFTETGARGWVKSGNVDA